MQRVHGAAQTAKHNVNWWCRLALSAQYWMNKRRQYWSRYWYGTGPISLFVIRNNYEVSHKSQVKYLKCSFGIAWCLCYKLTKYCTREASRVMKFLQSWESSGEAVHWEGNLCLCVVALCVLLPQCLHEWTLHSLVLFRKLTDKEGNTVRTGKPFHLVHVLPRCLYSDLFCWWTHMQCVSAADVSPVLNSVCQKRENKWAQNAWMTSIPPGESQLKLFLQVLETFSGIDM